MTATLNVNLKPCDCSHRRGLSSQCLPDCASQPVEVPCPVPRSWTLEVVLGECRCDERVRAPRLATWQTEVHDTDCPARPAKVSCSISGKTWEHIAAEDFDVHDHATDMLESQAIRDAAERACRARWALVKALVLGKHRGRDEFAVANPDTPEHLFFQRDAVFAALVRLVKADEARGAALQECAEAMRSGFFVKHAPSAEEVLGQYVELLMEQVSVLGVES